MERHLAAIFAADMVGYSRLMEADETGTMDRQKRHRAELIDPNLEKFNGRIVKLMGDGMLVEFGSVVDAVQCAVEIQRAMAEREGNIPDDRRIQYRIGINLGDIIIEDGDIFGDGVNIAARLEALAEPGGVVVSGTAYDHLKANIEVGYEDLGEQQVKNIATPVRVYRVVREGAPVVARNALGWRRSLIAAAAAVLVIAGVAAWKFTLGPDLAEKVLADHDPVLALPTGPKIVVLPFNNHSGDTDQDYFVDGLTQDLTTRLTDHGYLFVIARNSAFKYKGKSPDVRDVGRDFGVDYVVEGSVRRSGNQIRVNVQLLNAKDGTHVWAKTYDRKLDVEILFALQDDLTTGISAAIGGTKGAISRAELQGVGDKAPIDLAAYECVLLAWNFWNSFDPSLHLRARDCLEAAVERDPNYARGWAELSRLYRWEFEGNVNKRPNPLQRSENAAERATKLDPTSIFAHETRAWVMLIRRRKSDSLYSIDKALEFAPNNPERLQGAALLLAHVGQMDRSIAIWQKAIKLDPNPPSWSYWTPMHVHRQRGQYEKAYQYVLILKQTTGAWHWVSATEAYLLAYMGRMEEAREALGRALEQNPDFADTAKTEIEVWWWSQPDQVDHIMNGLYMAGLERVPAATE